MLTIVDDKNIGFSLGAADYLTKPIDWQRLSSVLARHGRGKDNQTVLVVEDDENAREMLRRTLQKESWQVREAAEWQEKEAALVADTQRRMDELRRAAGPGRGDA